MSAGSGESEALYTLVALVARFADPHDALLIWRARQATPETQSGVDVEQMARLGLDGVRRYLSRLHDANGPEASEAAAALAWLDEGERDGAFAIWPAISPGPTSASVSQSPVPPDASQVPGRGGRERRLTAAAASAASTGSTTGARSGKDNLKSHLECGDQSPVMGLAPSRRRSSSVRSSSSAGTAARSSAFSSG